jgi:hypothetical protein
VLVSVPASVETTGDMMRITLRRSADNFVVSGGSAPTPFVSIILVKFPDIVVRNIHGFVGLFIFLCEDFCRLSLTNSMYILKIV